MNIPRYDRGAIALHWLHAILVVGLLGWGLYMSDLPKGPERSFAIGLHKSFGVVALLVVALRLWWRLAHPVAPDPRLGALEQRLAGAGHIALYVLLVATPLAGYLSSSFTQYPMKVFGLAIPKAGWPDEALNAFFNGAHKLFAWTLLVLLVGHVAAVVIHALRGQPVLVRMLPARNRSG